jgi:plastocyanin
MLKRKLFLFGGTFLIIIVGGLGIFALIKSTDKNNSTTILDQTTSITQKSQTTISIEGFSFKPNSLTIKKGQVVIWTNNDSVNHTVTAKDGSFTSPALKKGETFSYTFNTPGTFNYSCSIHPSMSGTVIVEE